MVTLVAGGAGFMGSHLCQCLVAEGHSVVVLGNLSNGSVEQIQQLEGCPKFHFYEFDVSNTINLRKVFDTYSVYMMSHLAANAGIAKGEE